MRLQVRSAGVMPGKLRHIAPFSALGSEQLIVAAGRAALARYRDGDVVLDRGAFDDDDYFLLDGRVRLVAPDGKETLIDSGSDEAASALATTRPCVYEVRAAGAATCARMPREAVAVLRDCFAADGETAVEDVEQALTETMDMVQAIRADVYADTLRLPSLPDVAVRVRDAVSRESCDNRRVAEVVSLDPVIAAKLLKIANSPLCRGADPVRSLPDAIGRIGLATVSELIICFSLRDLFQCRERSMKKLFAGCVSEALRTGATAGVIAARAAPALQDRALIAGLLGNIGVYPLLQRLGERSEIAGRPERVSTIVREMAPRVGELICSHWGIGEDVADVARQFYNWDCPTAEGLTALVLCARYHALLGQGVKRLPAPDSIPAMGLLGATATPEDSLEILRDSRSRIDALLGALN